MINNFKMNDHFELNVRKKYNVIYVQCDDKMNVIDLMTAYENALLKFVIRPESFLKYTQNNMYTFNCLIDEKLTYDDLLCVDDFQIECSNVVMMIDEKYYNIHDLNTFIENQLSNSMCACNDFECKSKIYFFSYIPIERQPVAQIKYFTHVIEENSMNDHFWQNTIDKHFNMPVYYNDVQLKFAIEYMNEFLKYRQQQYNRISARYEIDSTQYDDSHFTKNIAQILNDYMNDNLSPHMSSMITLMLSKIVA